MELNLSFEVRVFFLCGLCGVACGILYDLFKILRRTICAGKGMTFFMDLFFWLFAAFLLFGMLLFANFGRLRVFEVLSILLGAAVYFGSVSPLVVSGGVLVMEAVFHTAEFLLKILFWPVRQIARFLFWPIRLFCKKILKKIRKKQLTFGVFWFKIKTRMGFYTKFLRK